MKSTLFAIILLLFSLAVSSQEVVEVKYKVKNFGIISVPGILEIQSGDYRKMADNEFLRLGFSYEVLQNKVVFQQKGLNQGDDGNTYVRVIVNTHFGAKGEFPKVKLTNDEISQLNNASEKSFEGTNMVLIKLYGWENISINDKYLAYRVIYVRKLDDNPNVYVESYTINNYDRKHTITFSYRVQDAEKWQPLFEKVLKSIVLESYE
jgi:hypothetical protein